MFCRFLSVRYHRLSWFLCLCVSRFVVLKAFDSYLCVLRFLFMFGVDILLFFFSFAAPFVFAICLLGWHIAVCLFDCFVWSFGVFWGFFCSETHFPGIPCPLFPPQLIVLTLLAPWTYLTTWFAFLPWTPITKHVVFRHFGLFLFCSFLPPVAAHLIAPILIHYYPFAFIFSHFWQNRQNIMSGEISPTIRPQILTCGPPNAPFLCRFCVSRTPCALMHPPTPIHINFYPFFTVCTLN